jgi:hypothetical protein
MIASRAVSVFTGMCSCICAHIDLDFTSFQKKEKTAVSKTDSYSSFLL